MRGNQNEQNVQKGKKAQKVPTLLNLSARAIATITFRDLINEMGKPDFSLQEIEKLILKVKRSGCKIGSLPLNSGFEMAVWNMFQSKAAALFDDIIAISNFKAQDRFMNNYNDDIENEIRKKASQHLATANPKNKSTYFSSEFCELLYSLSKKRFLNLANIRKDISFYKLSTKASDDLDEVSKQYLTINRSIFLEPHYIEKVHSICVNNQLPNDDIAFELFVVGACLGGSLKLLELIWKKSDLQFQRQLLSRTRGSGDHLWSAIVGAVRSGNADCLKSILNKWEALFPLVIGDIPKFHEQIHVSLTAAGYSFRKKGSITMPILLRSCVRLLVLSSRTASDEEIKSMQITEVFFDRSRYNEDPRSLHDMLAEIFKYNIYGLEVKQVMIDFLKEHFSTAQEFIDFKEKACSAKLFRFVNSEMKEQIHKSLDPVIEEYQAKESDENANTSDDSSNGMGLGTT